MTREESIIWLKLMKDQYPDQTVATKALDMAIDALQATNDAIKTDKDTIQGLPSVSAVPIQGLQSDLISRADAIGLVKKICWNCSNTICINLINAFKALPSVSTAELLAELGVATFDELMEEPSAERVGVWLHKEMWNDVLDKNISYIECSECGHAPYYGGATETPNYCPNCGARMENTK